MEPHLHRLHIGAGLACGRDKTCGKKINWQTEERAHRAASDLSIKYAPKNLEAYPCPFCNGWHIGRAMELSELERMSRIIRKPRSVAK